MKISVVGTGYVGLVSGTCFAEVDNDVTCVDIDEHKVARMLKGEVPIYEPGLEAMFKRNVEEGRLHFTSDLAEGIQGAAIIFLALPTPPGEDGSADLSYVLGAAEDVGKLLADYTVIVDKSTVPVGTAEKVREQISKHAPVEFDVVSNPEFLREGRAVDDFMRPNRVVIGSSSDRARALMEDLYTSFVDDKRAIISMDERSAEMTKYAANSFLVTKISFMNEIANLCEEAGANVDHVRLGIGSDERIGKHFLFPGIGYGGSCFPKDVQALQKTAAEHSSDLRIIDAAMHVNDEQKRRLPKKIMAYYNGDLTGKRFGLWGLAFKPDTDDVREAPALEIIRELIEAGATVAAYDPEALENVRKQLGDGEGLDLIEDAYAAAEGADALIIATEWSEFKTPDFAKLKATMKQPVIFDGRNVFALEAMADRGFDYISIGRQPVKA